MDTPLVQKNIVGLVGNLTSVEELYFFFKYLKKLQNATLFLNKNLFKFNVDLPNFYLFNSKFISIDSSDLILLIGTNPRIESSLLNVRILNNFLIKKFLLDILENFQILHIRYYI